ncbi:MAG: hypothetical protein AAF809_09975, partial [Bacteroidota bacterium]
ERSVLMDAYKRNELNPATGLGLLTLSAQPVDRAEPSEALKATTVWQAGLDADAHLVSSRQLDAFRRGDILTSERDVRAERGAYFAHATLAMQPGDAQRWLIVAELDQDAADVADLDAQLADPAALIAAVEADADAGTERLHRLVASADGLQATADRRTTARHRTNVLFNMMRGGVFEDGYAIDTADVIAFVQQRNVTVDTAPLAALPAQTDLRTLLDMLRTQTEQDGDPQLERLGLEYLPLSFSRRHGDPSRPWNTFTISLRNEDGSVKRDYQGNWRDIFQNWEALGLAFPGFAESMVAVFVNASTADGYNPYRIARGGIDWEIVEPDDPWSYIGYWGDHQLIYLLKLLDLSRAHHPGRLGAMLDRRLFAYANVPYRIRSYADLLADPRTTIDFDNDVQEEIEDRVSAVGADGKLLLDGDGRVHLVTLAEKLLVPLLAKLSNFVPGGGIWMNTQRPEWNDANNALVGYGVSMVTLFELRQYLDTVQALFEEDATGDALVVSEEVATLLDAIAGTFSAHARGDDAPLSDEARKTMVDRLGEAGDAYRQALYAHGFSGHTRDVDRAALIAAFEDIRTVVDRTLRRNRRDDGMVHAYNLLRIESDRIGVRTLYPMLEGQVAALGAGALSPEATLEVVQALRRSDLYRPDQHTYMLYPNRDLPRFREKNVIPADAVAASPLLQRLLAEGNQRLVVQDRNGAVHFNGSFRNRRDVETALDELWAGGYAEAEAERDALGTLFDDLFDHHAYTGRSGTFFGYEGLGSVYWHMVSKLILAVQKSYERAHKTGAAPAVVRQLAEAYYDVRDGVGLNKTPTEYGAFPIDPYSHTPGHAGAKQPGMTGLVKEDILWRWGELGVQVVSGQLRFEPRLLRASEFLDAPAEFRYVGLDGREHTLPLKTGSLAFTYVQVPVVYHRASTPRIRVVRSETREEAVEGTVLPADLSAEVFERRGTIARIEVSTVLEA